MCETRAPVRRALILDEVVTDFRYARRCQEYYRLKPDLSTFGKALGAGFPDRCGRGPARDSRPNALVRQHGLALWDLQRTSPDDERDRSEPRLCSARKVPTVSSTPSERQPLPACAKSFAVAESRPSCKASARCSRSTSRSARSSTTTGTTAGYVDPKRYSRFVHLLLDHGIYMTPSNGLHWIISTKHTDMTWKR